MIHIKYLTLIPFGCFLLGYLVVNYVVGPQTFRAPALVGSSLIQGCYITTTHSLALKIVGHKETTESSPGTILHQTPAAGSSIKKNQSMYVVIAQEPTPQCTPNLIGMFDTDIRVSKYARSHAIKIYEVPSIYPRGICITQYPKAGDPTPDGQVIVYISQKQPAPIIWPSFIGKTVTDALHFLRTHDLPVSCIHSDQAQVGHDCSACIVVQQHPHPGSLISLSPDKPIQVQLHVV